MLVFPVANLSLGQKPDVFILIGLPFIIVASATGYILYARIVRPSAVALGSLIPRFCVVSSDEIGEHCGSTQETSTQIAPDQTRWVQVARKYIAQMTWNTKLIQQLARFEQLKIDPRKSSLDYESRETLIVRLAEEATAVRLLLLKAQIVLSTPIFSGTRLRAHLVERLQHLMREYKQLEFNTVTLVGMARDECYYGMLVERLGLSNWNL